MENEREPKYAGFWLRAWAAALDSLLLMALLVPAALAVYGVSYFTSPGGWFRGPADLFLQVVLPFLLVFWFWKRWLATPGKMLLASKIVDARSGADPTSRQLLLRYLGYFVGLIPLGLGFFWVLWDGRKQGWHDKLAGTVVIVDREAASSRRLWRWLALASGVTVLVTAAAVLAAGLWLWQNQELLTRDWAGAQEAFEQGMLAGAGGKAERCPPQAFQRLEQCTGFFCVHRSSMFLAGCLGASPDADEFCSGVPTSLSSIAFAEWPRQQCRELGREDLSCVRLMSFSMTACRTLPETQRGAGGFVR